MSIKVKKFISGGQTGADKTGLIEAKLLGFEVGGTVPKGCRTETGADYSLIKDYGCVESKDWHYVDRTHKNAADSDATLWFGTTTSPGYYCTKRGCDKAGKPIYVNPTLAQIEYAINSYEVINIAGNRESKNSLVVKQVPCAFDAIKKLKNTEQRVGDEVV